MHDHCRLFCCIVFAVLLAMALTEKEKAAGLQALARAPSLPLIRALLEQMPPKPRVFWKRQVSSQHLNYMLDLYRKSADRNGRPRVNRTVGSNTVRLVKSSGRTEHYVQDHWLVQNLEFHLEGFPEVKHLVRAVLVYSQAQLTDGSWLSCKVELLMEGGVQSQYPIGSTKTSIHQGGTPHTNDFRKKWAELDLTSYLKSLAGEPEHKCQQPLRIRHLCNQSGNMVNPLPWQKDETSQRVPFLLLYLNNTHQSSTETNNVVLNVPSLATETKTSFGVTRSRRARQAGNIGLKLPSYRQKNSISKNECTLRSFRVSFHQLGWDHWIIAPHRYNPKYCKGDCPRVLRYGYNSPNHAIVQNFINELVDQSVPRPSCVPYKYSPISVLMIEPNGSILYKEYENMIAESCTCR